MYLIPDLQTSCHRQNFIRSCKILKDLFKIWPRCNLGSFAILRWVFHSDMGIRG